MPVSIIHGDFYPANILVAPSRHRTRICPIDWEMAAIGPPSIDLAALITGWTGRQRLALIRAYRGGAGAAFLRDLDCCTLHLAVRMLGWSDRWMPPPQQAHDWTSEALAAAARLDAS
jgi:aminoglycoside phosphotransferase (APT) family kinase protein